MAKTPQKQRRGKPNAAPPRGRKPVHKCTPLTTKVEQITGLLRRSEGASLDEMVRPSLLGWSGLTDTDVGSDRLDLVEESTQALLSADEDQIIVRSFRLPPNAVYDPTIPQSERQSWILDIDAGDPRRSPFSTASICDSATRLADRCHSAFRWAVTDKFIERYR